VVVVTGAIATGKSTLSRVLAARLGGAAVVDLDLVYEMLVDPATRKDDDAIWARTRRVTAHLVEALLDEGARTVIVDGEIELDGALRIVLHAPLETAYARVDADPARTFSRDRGFLAEHYANASFEGDLRFDTSEVSADAIADAIAQRLASGR
jgi:shikimate kinase